jgi:hypothetical protein
VIISAADNPDHFVKNINLSLQNSQYKSSQRLAVAKDHVWEKQARKFFNIIQNKFELRFP